MADTNCWDCETECHSKDFLCFVTFIPRTTKTVKALQLAHDSGVIMVSMPGHITNRVQPMDVAFFRPLNSCQIELKIGYEPILGDMSLKESGSDIWLCVWKTSYCGHGNQRLQVYRDMASKQICISRPSFLSCGEHFRSCLCTASSGRVTRWCGSRSSLSQRTRNGNTYLLVPVEKISPLSKAHTACSNKKTAQVQSVSEGDRTFSSWISTRQVTKKSNR